MTNSTPPSPARSPDQTAAGHRRPSLGIRVRIDVEEYSKLELVKYAASRVPAGALMLDAGAGDCPHRHYFSHARYESSDFRQNKDGTIDYVCDVQALTCPDSKYDAVLSIQVLDDLPDPQRAVNEMYRVLKPGGSLFLTVPMSGRIHGSPYHFFHFTHHGLEHLLHKAGFKVEMLRPRGGVFWYMSYISRRLPAYLYRQQVQAARDCPPGAGRLGRRIAAAASLPVYLLSIPFCKYLLPLSFFYLDRLDREQSFTVGYSCEARKPAG